MTTFRLSNLEPLRFSDRNSSLFSLDHLLVSEYSIISFAFFFHFNAYFRLVWAKYHRRTTTYYFSTPFQAFWFKTTQPNQMTEILMTWTLITHKKEVDMKKSNSLAIFLVGVFVLGIFTSSALGEVYWPEKWWPSKWGADDEKGSFNTITPQKILSSIKVVKTGKYYRLGRPYEMSMPKYWSRHRQSRDCAHRGRGCRHIPYRLGQLLQRSADL